MREVLSIILWGGVIGAWFTSVANAIKYDRIALIIADVIMPPVGVIHGIILWFS